ncbi:RCC1/BLIP-II protein [Fistulina hepatica ATCC 64428]|uniref:RCC1/BLIP-II protein n=1 Tax=Fistulina hepatica ATCC 64428 TaxID=1128425 RepID=A0A0D7AGF0_9AGAR|nr:RCC1/BLIP-II protein [Fistulina hepatica ATCC 64428]
MRLLSSGSNARGQLGHGALDDAHVFRECIYQMADCPFELPVGTQIVQVASGANHTLVLFSDNTTLPRVWGCGDASSGQLGPVLKEKKGGNSEETVSLRFSSRTVFQPVHIDLASMGLDGYTCNMLTCAWESTYLVLRSLDRSDALISFGANSFGELGVGLSSHPGPHLVALQGREPTCCPCVSVVRIDSVDAGLHHVIVRITERLQNGTRRHRTMGWGVCRHGQLGTIAPPASDSDAQLQAAARARNSGPSHINLPCYVFQNSAPPSEEGKENSVVAVALGSSHSVLCHSSGHLRAFGTNRKLQIFGVDGVRVPHIACTWNGTYWIGEDGAIHATGSNTHGQLGAGTRHGLSFSSGELQVSSNMVISTTKMPRRIVAGSEHVLVLLSSNTEKCPADMIHCFDEGVEVWAWGWNEHGNLGNSTTEDALRPVRIWPQAAENGNYAQIADDQGDNARVRNIWGGQGTSWIAIE